MKKTKKVRKKYITEISLEDFKKLDLIVYEHRKVETGDGYTYKIQFVPVKMNDIIEHAVDIYKGTKEELNNILVAIHTSPEIKKDAPDDLVQMIVFENSYLDKYMNQYSGMRTYQIAENVEGVYSTRDYWMLKEDYWQVKKKETKSIYLIHMK